MKPWINKLFIWTTTSCMDQNMGGARGSPHPNPVVKNRGAFRRTRPASPGAETSAPGGLLLVRLAEPQLLLDLGQEPDHVLDVIVEGDAQVLGALGDVVA